MGALRVGGSPPASPDLGEARAARAGVGRGGRAAPPARRGLKSRSPRAEGGHGGLRLGVVRGGRASMRPERWRAPGLEGGAGPLLTSGLEGERTVLRSVSAQGAWTSRVGRASAHGSHPPWSGPPAGQASLRRYLVTGCFWKSTAASWRCGVTRMSCTRSPPLSREHTIIWAPTLYCLKNINSLVYRKRRDIKDMLFASKSLKTARNRPAHQIRASR
jgi:hypothetical protein